MLGTIRKAGQVFDLFTPQAPEWGVSQAARELGIAKSNAHALLATLSEIGLLRRTSRGRYRLGWRLLALSRSLLESSDVRGAAAPAIQELVHEHGETVHLAAWEQGRVVCVEKLQGTTAPRIPNSAVGAPLPAHATAVGKVLLAEQPAPGSFPTLTPLTPLTLVAPDALAAELARVRATGVAFDRGEAQPGLRCVAAPIRDGAGEVVAALSIAAPGPSFDARGGAYHEAVVRAADDVTRRLRADGRAHAAPTRRLGRQRAAAAVPPPVV